jgi:hypothetical protein
MDARSHPTFVGLVVDAAISIFAVPCRPSCVNANSVTATLASSRGDQCGDPSLSPAQHLNEFSESSSGPTRMRKKRDSFFHLRRERELEVGQSG